MGSLLLPVSLPTLSRPPPASQAPAVYVAAKSAGSRSRAACWRRGQRHLRWISHSDPGVPEEAGSETLVKDLRVPDAWLTPSNALQESEWLRAALHEWLDDEYCPEASNVEISRVAARSYYESLMAKQTDLGEILLKMATDLEALSFQESFHGPFMSANAAVHLVTQRMDSMGWL